MQHLPLCTPSKIIGTHVACRSRHNETRAGQTPVTPTYFTKPPSSMNVHGGELVRPASCQYLNHEGEIAVIIGRVTRNVTPAEAWECIAGFVVSGPGPRATVGHLPTDSAEVRRIALGNDERLPPQLHRVQVPRHGG